jgi:hypothetical protein
MAQSFKLTFNGPAVTAAGRQSALRGIQRALAIFDREWVRRVLQEAKSGRRYGNHIASAPGESFASDTGRTVNSRKLALDPATLTGTWSVTSRHARALEFGTSRMAARPTARPAFAAKRREMIAAIEAAYAQGMK